MARIRTIKPEFWQDEKLSPLQPIDRLVFLGLISQADDAGRLVDSPKLINGLLFSGTDHDCTESLQVLADIEVIDRGVTESGLGIIQIAGWSRHQRVEKPNLKGALPAAVISRKRRRKIPDKIREAIYERDQGLCQECGIEVRIGKRDKYDSDPELAEIDHIVAVADGGTNHPENLRLTCLGCNRKKAGEDVRRRNAERSGKNPGKVPEEQQNHTYDQRPTTNDQRPPTADLPPEPEPVREEATAAAAKDDAIEEMQAAVAEYAERVVDTDQRKRLEGYATMIVGGDDMTAWQGADGGGVEWARRPRLLRLALQRWLAEYPNGGQLRSHLRYVIAQQLDPHKLPKSTAPSPGSEASRVTDELPRHNGSQVPTVDPAVVADKRDRERRAAVAAWVEKHPDEAQAIEQEVEKEVAADTVLPGSLRPGVIEATVRTRIAALMERPP